MFVLDGKYGSAHIFTDHVEQTAQAQIMDLLNTPLAAGASIRVMPDCHAGAGCVIGLTMTVTDMICPNLVGVDIGCGMLATKLHMLGDVDFEKLDKVIEETVPSGFNVHNGVPSEAKGWEDRLKQLRCADHVDIGRALKSVGTLGGGNHFIEMNRDNAGFVWLIIHSGSRKLGLEIAAYYQKLAEERCSYNGVPKALRFLVGQDMADYLHDMYIAQDYANDNRLAMYNRIVQGMGYERLIEHQFRTVHNYINPNDGILRKGAVASYQNNYLVIPMNMRDGTLLCTGKSSPEWNFSAPHGAGRIMSRSQAKKALDIEEYARQMQDVYTTCVSYSTIDESPMAYKPIREILDHVGDTVRVIDTLKPIYNFKAGGD